MGDSVVAVVQNNLFERTALQSVYSGNFLALMGSGTEPKRFTLRSALDYFLDFRFFTIRRKCVYHMEKVATRDHIVRGLMLSLESIDEVISIVRNAKDLHEARIE